MLYRPYIRLIERSSEPFTAAVITYSTLRLYTVATGLPFGTLIPSP